LFCFLDLQISKIISYFAEESKYLIVKQLNEYNFMGAFIDPSTDWGFKKIFGDKELLTNSAEYGGFRLLSQGCIVGGEVYG